RRRTAAAADHRRRRQERATADQRRIAGSVRRRRATAPHLRFLDPHPDPRRAAGRGERGRRTAGAGPAARRDRLRHLGRKVQRARDARAGRRAARAGVERRRSDLARDGALAVSDRRYETAAARRALRRSGARRSESDLGGSVGRRPPLAGATGAGTAAAGGGGQLLRIVRQPLRPPAPRCTRTTGSIRLAGGPAAEPTAARAAVAAGATGRGRTWKGEADAMKWPRMPGRFEWKILAALFIVAALPVAGAALSTSFTIGRMQVITEQHQEAVQQALGGAVDVYRSYFAQMKENFRDRGNEIAAAHITRASELADVPDLLRARIMEGNRVVDEWAQPPEVQERAHEAPPTLVALPAITPTGEPRVLELTFGISREIYANLLALREAMEKGHDLDRV